MAISERFDIFADSGAYLGTCPRAEVHSTGHWHRSAQVFVFNSAQELLLQKRASSKDVCPDLWDYSVGEHLQPSESFIAGAVRGLREELGIEGVAIAPVCAPQRRQYTDAEQLDREIQMPFVCSTDAATRIDLGEVQAIQWVSKVQLAEWVARRPDDFTPWFLAFYRSLSLFS